MFDGLASYFDVGLEMVLHSLENLENSVIHIINGHYSGRKPGAPITDLALNALPVLNEGANNSIAPYFIKNASGAVIKSATIPIRGENSRIIGLLCINCYTDTPLSDLIKSLTPPQDNSGQTPLINETFAQDTVHMIEIAVADAKQAVYNEEAISTANKNKEIIVRLYDNGIFNLKDAVIKVAELLNISKNTVYLHLRNLSKQ